MRISDWSSDVCSSDLEAKGESAPDSAPAAKLNDGSEAKVHARRFAIVTDASRDALLTDFGKETLQDRYLLPGESYQDLFARVADAYADDQDHAQRLYRSEEHTSELQSLMRISYAVFCLK